MKGVSEAGNSRILIVDDNEAIHQDFRKILGAHDGGATGLAASEAALFGDLIRPAQARFDLDSAFQGEQALAMLIRAAPTNRASSRSSLPRPYIWRFTNLSLERFSTVMNHRGIPTGRDF